MENAGSMQAICRETGGGNLLSAGDFWAWGNTLPGKKIYHCDLWFSRLLVICVQRMLGLCVWGNAILGEARHCDSGNS